MSLKNQSRLTIFATVIIVLTAVALFSLNLVINKISQATPEHLAIEGKIPKAAPPAGHSVDDSLSGSDIDDAAPDKSPEHNRMKNKPSFNIDPQAGANIRKFGGATKPQAPVTRPPMPGGHPGGYPGGPPGMPPRGMGPEGYYPPGFPPGFNPNDPAMMEQMERQRQMMMQQGGPPGYPPEYYPQMPDDGYPDMDDYYDGPPGYYYDPYGYESKYEQHPDNQERHVLSQESDEHEEFDRAEREEGLGADDFIQDEYLREYLDEN
jgi:hypothetical protein